MGLWACHQQPHHALSPKGQGSHVKATRVSRRNRTEHRRPPPLLFFEQKKGAAPCGNGDVTAWRAGERQDWTGVSGVLGGRKGKRSRAALPRFTQAMPQRRDTVCLNRGVVRRHGGYLGRALAWGPFVHHAHTPFFFTAPSHFPLAMAHGPHRPMGTPLLRCQRMLCSLAPGMVMSNAGGSSLVLVLPPNCSTHTHTHTTATPQGVISLSPHHEPPWQRGHGTLQAPGQRGAASLFRSSSWRHRVWDGSHR